MQGSMRMLPYFRVRLQQSHGVCKVFGALCVGHNALQNQWVCERLAAIPYLPPHTLPTLIPELIFTHTQKGPFGRYLIGGRSDMY